MKLHSDIRPPPLLAPDPSRLPHHRHKPRVLVRDPQRPIPHTVPATQKVLPAMRVVDLVLRQERDLQHDQALAERGQVLPHLAQRVQKLAVRGGGGQLEVHAAVGGGAFGHEAHDGGEDAVGQVRGWVVQKMLLLLPLLLRLRIEKGSLVGMMGMRGHGCCEKLLLALRDPERVVMVLLLLLLLLLSSLLLLLLL
ncbi:hypothetical protein DFH27DRAFT_581374 [Peziza echinospora]|nr:hypothetical protein DFH27DRAFT_581374 [Peziza echinospora]